MGGSTGSRGITLGVGVRVCLSCHELEQAHQPFVTRAYRGVLRQICSRCFHLQELHSLCGDLRPTDEVRRTVEEGLETLYVTARLRVEEVRDGAEGQAQGQG